MFDGTLATTLTGYQVIKKREDSLLWRLLVAGWFSEVKQLNAGTKSDPTLLQNKCFIFIP